MTREKPNRFIARRQNATSAPIKVVSRSKVLFPAYQQERLWFLDRLDDGASAAYHVEGAVRLLGSLDTRAMLDTLQALVVRHESLRMHFAADESGRPKLVIVDNPSNSAFGVEDASGLCEQDLLDRVSHLRREPFDLAAGPLFRARILSVSDTEHVLVVGGHHTVLDGWSVGHLMKEMSALYRERSAGIPANLSPLEIDYADYAAWQRHVFSGVRLEREAAWWKNQLNGIPDAITLPTDRPRPAVMDYRGASVPIAIGSTSTDALKAFARAQDATLFMVLSAAFSAVLSRIGAGVDVVIGTAVAGRVRPEFEELVGFFVNTLTLRHRVEGQMTFGAHVAATKETVLEAFAHGELPFDQVVEAVDPARSLSFPPLIQVMLVLHNTPSAASVLDLPNIVSTPFGQEEDRAQFELSLSLTETTQGLVGRLSYASQLFARDTAVRLASMFTRFVDRAVHEHGNALSDLPLMDSDERDRVLRTFNNRSTAGSYNKTALDLFSAQALARPNAIAVLDADHALSYHALDTASNRLARHLIHRGVGADTVVGVSLERSAALIIALLATWKAGGAYLPLDPDYPAARLQYMRQDADARIIIAITATATSLAGDDEPAPSNTSTDEQLILLDHSGTRNDLADLSEEALTEKDRIAPLTAKNLAYVIYTSGSTGRPKGVLVEHRNLANLLGATDALYQFGVADVWSQFHAFAFDFSVWEVWGALSTGGRLVTVPQLVAQSPREFCNLAASAGITVLNQTPSAFLNMLSNVQDASARLEKVRAVIFGGEKCVPHHLAPWFAAPSKGQARMFNMYGITETTVHVTHMPFSSEALAGEGSPIGCPLQGLRVYILDRKLEPVPIGIGGEIFVGGDQLGRGYLGDPGSTAASFIADPFSHVPGARLYRTGDVARWRADGTLEFLGRVDDQVKIRGMRVEPSEIEAALLGLDGIEQAVVAAHSGEAGDKRLVAYVVPALATKEAAETTDDVTADDWRGTNPNAVRVLDGTVLNPAAIRAELRRILPAHMIPSEFVAVSALPLTASGKIDLKALPDVGTVVARSAYAAPRNDTEVLMCELMRDVIAHDRRTLDRVGVDDNFFDIGGHSVFAAQFAMQLERALGREVRVQLIFEAPTVRELSETLQTPWPEPTAEAIDMLRASPELSPQFDEIFGEGAAARVLDGTGT